MTQEQSGRRISHRRGSPRSPARDHGRPRRAPRGAAAGDRGGDPRAAGPGDADRGRPRPGPPARGALPVVRGRRCSSARSPSVDIAYVVDHIGSFGDDNRAGIERTLHRISAIRNRNGKIVGLTCRIGRAVYGTIEIIADFVETGKSILIMGRPGIGKTTMLREAARVLADEQRKRVVVVDTSQRDRGRRRHPAPGDREGAADAGPDAAPPARGDDRGGREPHAPGHRHRRDRDRARGAGGAHHRRARRPADRHGARQQPRQPDAQPDAVGPHRRHPERDPRRRGGAPPPLAEERPRAQGAADVRRHRRDPGPREGPRPRRRRRDGRRDAARRRRSRPSSAGATRRACTAPSRGPSRRRARPSAATGSAA